MTWVLYVLFMAEDRTLQHIAEKKFFETEQACYQHYNNHKASIDNITTLTVIATFAFILSLMHEIIKDLRTMEGDKKYKIRTLPTVWGL